MNISSISKKTPLIKKVEKISKTNSTQNHMFRDTLVLSEEAKKIKENMRRNNNT